MDFKAVGDTRAGSVTRLSPEREGGRDTHGEGQEKKPTQLLASTIVSFDFKHGGESQIGACSYLSRGTLAEQAS